MHNDFTPSHLLYTESLLSKTISDVIKHFFLSSPESDLASLSSGSDVELRLYNVHVDESDVKEEEPTKTQGFQYTGGYK